MKNLFVVGFILLLAGCKNENRQNTTIAILPMGLNEKHEYIIDEVEYSIAQKAEFNVVVLNPVSMPRLAYYEPRKRYRAEKILKYLKGVKPDSVDYIVAITSEDISTAKNGKKDWGIFGLGYRPGVASVVSIFRLGNNKKVLTRRVLKITKHELGHNFGLPHCKKSKTCVMSSAEGSIKTVDRVSNIFCKACQSKLAN
jgi:archaemetzincin